jgi:hypothetical protein
VDQSRKIKDKEKKEKIAKIYLEFQKDLQAARLRRYELLKAAREQQDKKKVEEILGNE